MKKENYYWSSSFFSCDFIDSYLYIKKGHTSEGVAYIKEQEALKTKKLSKKLTNKRIEEKTTLIKEGKIDVFSMFDDYVLYGDSRVYGFGSYGFLPWNNVFAAARKYNLEYYGL